MVLGLLLEREILQRPIVPCGPATRRPAPAHASFAVPTRTRGTPPVRNPRDFFKPLAIGAPEPLRDIPFKPSRMIHFLDFSNEKMVAKVPDIAPTVDILLGNLEDAVPVDRKEAARDGLVRVGKEMELGETQLWTRVNSLESPWVLDDITTLVSEIGDRLEGVMGSQCSRAWVITYVE